MTELVSRQELTSEGVSAPSLGIPAPCGAGCSHIKGRWKRERCPVHYMKWLEVVPKDERPPGRCLGRTEPRYKTVYDALAAHTVQMPGENGCLMWRSSSNQPQLHYPVLYFRGGRYKAHHLAYVLHYQRDVPAGLNVLHDCDQPACVRGEHLALGNQAQNIADVYCRQRWNPKIVKLDWAKAKQIRRLVAATGPVSRKDTQTLADQYGVCTKTIRDVIEGRTWIPKCDGVSK